MKSFIFVSSLGIVAYLSIYFYKYKYKSYKKLKSYEEKVYTIARRLPLENGLILEFGIKNNDEMIRIIDQDEYIVISSKKVIDYKDDNEKEKFFIHFSENFCLEATKDTISIYDSLTNDIHNIHNIRNIRENIKKINMGSPTFDTLFDFFENI